MNVKKESNGWEAFEMLWMSVGRMQDTQEATDLLCKILHAVLPPQHHNKARIMMILIEHVISARCS